MGDVSESTTLRQRIRAEIKRRAWSMRQASLEAGLNEDTLGRFLRGQNKTLEPDSCRGIARAFAWPEDEVLAMAGHRSPLAPGDPVAAINDALLTGQWSSRARAAILSLVEETNQQRQQAHWREAIEQAVEEILDEPVAAGGGDWTAEDVVAFVRHELPERLLEILARNPENRPP